MHEFDLWNHAEMNAVMADEDIDGNSIPFTSPESRFHQSKKPKNKIETGRKQMKPPMVTSHFCHLLLRAVFCRDRFAIRPFEDAEIVLAMAAVICAIGISLWPLSPLSKPKLEASLQEKPDYAVDGKPL